MDRQEKRGRGGARLAFAADPGRRAILLERGGVDHAMSGGRHDGLVDE
jgi:hypothetical protein